MAVEYLELQAEAEAGPFARVTAHKLQQSWETLQAALDELGPYGWDLCTTIYSATREHRGPGEHYCETAIPRCGRREGRNFGGSGVYSCAASRQAKTVQPLVWWTAR